jgi:hypothetical protein
MRAGMGLSAAVVTVAATVALLAPHAGAGGKSGGDDDGHTKVTICHRTSSDEHPYKEKRISAKGALNGHGRHHAVQAVWSPGMKAKREKWGDIVPAFDVGTQHFAGLNLDTEGGADGHTSGQEILDAHCAVGGGG